MHASTLKVIRGVTGAPSPRTSTTAQPRRSPIRRDSYGIIWVRKARARDGVHKTMDPLRDPKRRATAFAIPPRRRG